MEAGFRVGIIAQPDIASKEDISRLGEPRLFWGVTGGSIDSMVANRTATNKRRKRDDYTPGGENVRRPDRASIRYANLIREHFKGTAPIVLGGIEASLRRVAHYDFWTDRVRKSILLDAKADYLVYGMAERSVVELATALRDNGQGAARKLKGLCFITKEKPKDALALPSFEDVASDKKLFERMFKLFYKNKRPLLPLRSFRRDTAPAISSKTLRRPTLPEKSSIRYTPWALSENNIRITKN